MVSNDIKSIRATTNLSQTAFAAALGIPLRTVQDWERGVRNCPQYVVDLIAFRVEHDTAFQSE